MDSTVVAAFIGVGGAVLVAVVGSVTTARTIRQSLADARLSARAGLDAGHEERVWDKKAELYVDLLLDEARRRADRADRREDFKSARFGERPPGPVMQHDEQSWSNFEARVRAFGSDPVLQAFQQARLASQAVHDHDKEWQDSSTAIPASGAERPVEAVVRAMAQADEVDGLLAGLIRDDLRAPLTASSALMRSR
jgi:hypothetical protein